MSNTQDLQDLQGKHDQHDQQDQQDQNKKEQKETTIPEQQVAKREELSSARFPRVIECVQELVNDNLEYLMNCVYKKYPDDAEARVGVAIHLLILCQKKIQPEIASLLIKDLDEFAANVEYLSQWKNPDQRRERIEREIKLIRKMTHNDLDTASLNTTADSVINDQKNVTCVVS